MVKVEQEGDLPNLSVDAGVPITIVSAVGTAPRSKARLAGWHNPVRHSGKSLRGLEKPLPPLGLLLTFIVGGYSSLCTSSSPEPHAHPKSERPFTHLQ